MVCERGSESQTSGDSSTSPRVTEVEMRNGLAPKLVTWRQHIWVLRWLTPICFVTLYKRLQLFLSPVCKRRVVFAYLMEVLDT